MAVTRFNSLIGFCYYIVCRQTTSLLEEIGGIEQVNSNFNADRIPKNLSELFQQNLVAWADFTRTKTIESAETVITQSIWNNKSILIENKSIFTRIFQCTI